VTYETAAAYLFSLERRGVRLGLDRVVGAFREHDDPQESFPAVLIAGTNGKGSTSVLTASILQAAGLRTGLFTSPHLIDFRERIRVDGRMIPPDAVMDLTERIRGSVDRWELSFFEATTLLAFLWFRESGVQAAAVEVGLGGRLDATRPVRSVVNVVTSIGLDHVKILGETRGAIAAEKAGILRSGVPVAIGVANAEAVGVLRRRAQEVGSPLHERRRALRVRGVETTADGGRFRVVARPGHPGPADELTLDLHLAGPHQIANAALSILALSLVPGAIRPGPAAIVEGVRRARWPGRLSLISATPRVLADVAHNPDGARYLARTLAMRGERPLRLVLGMLQGKDHEGFLRPLAERASHVHACTPVDERALPGEELARLALAYGLPASLHADPAAAIDAAVTDVRPGETILVTGSFFTVGEVMERMGIAPSDPLWPAAAP
jgi:dihydrofolate synthase / folylpolyglutamate synthase